MLLPVNLVSGANRKRSLPEFGSSTKCLYIRSFVNSQRPIIALPFKVLMLCFLAGIGIQSAFAQPAKGDTANYIQSYWYNGIGLLKRPLHFSGDQWITAAGSLVIVGSMTALDEPVNVVVADWQTDFANNFGKAGDVIGGAPFQLGISGSAMLVGSLAKSKPLLNFGLDNLQSQVFTGGVTFIVKNLFHRARPEAGEGAFAWYGPFNGWGNESFFSGHTALAFSTANMIFLHSKKKWWVGLLGFGTATAVGISRMQQQKHWSSDVMMGAIMGTVISTFVYKQQEKRRDAKQAVRLKILP